MIISDPPQLEATTYCRVLIPTSLQRGEHRYRLAGAKYFERGGCEGTFRDAGWPEARSTGAEAPLGLQAVRHYLPAYLLHCGCSCRTAAGPIVRVGWRDPGQGDIVNACIYEWQ